MEALNHEVLDVDMQNYTNTTHAEETRITSWYENRDERITGTWEQYEERVKRKLAAHVAETIRMNMGETPNRNNGDGGRI